jgi:hypothetical protein
MAQYGPDELVFLDETSKDERTLFRRRGRSKEGTRATMRGVFVRGRRLQSPKLWDHAATVLLKFRGAVEEI